HSSTYALCTGVANYCLTSDHRWGIFSRAKYFHLSYHPPYPSFLITESILLDKKKKCCLKRVSYTSVGPRDAIVLFFMRKVRKGNHSSVRFCILSVMLGIGHRRRDWPCLLLVFSTLAARTVTIYGYQSRYQPRIVNCS